MWLPALLSPSLFITLWRCQRSKGQIDAPGSAVYTGTPSCSRTLTKAAALRATCSCNHLTQITVVEDSTIKPQSQTQPMFSTPNSTYAEEAKFQSSSVSAAGYMLVPAIAGGAACAFSCWKPVVVYVSLSKKEKVKISVANQF